MKLKRISIYAKHTGGFLGTLEVEGELGKIECNLNDEQARKVVAMCANALVATAKDVAAKLSTAMLEEHAKPASSDSAAQ